MRVVSFFFKFVLVFLFGSFVFVFIQRYEKIGFVPISINIMTAGLMIFHLTMLGALSLKACVVCCVLCVVCCVVLWCGVVWRCVALCGVVFACINLCLLSSCTSLLLLSLPCAPLYSLHSSIQFHLLSSLDFLTLFFFAAVQTECWCGCIINFDTTVQVCE